MMDIVIICAFAMFSAVMCLWLKTDTSEIRFLLTAVSCIVILLKTVGSLSGIIAEIRSLFTISGLDPEYLRILLKGLGICHITGFTSGVCRDSGESALAEQTVIAGKTALVLLALPMLETLICFLKSLLQ